MKRVLAYCILEEGGDAKGWTSIDSSKIAIAGMSGESIGELGSNEAYFKMVDTVGQSIERLSVYVKGSDDKVVLSFANWKKIFEAIANFQSSDSTITTLDISPLVASMGEGYQAKFGEQE